MATPSKNAVHASVTTLLDEAGLDFIAGLKGEGNFPNMPLFQKEPLGVTDLVQWKRPGNNRHAFFLLNAFDQPIEYAGIKNGAAKKAEVFYRQGPVLLVLPTDRIRSGTAAGGYRFGHGPDSRRV